MGQKTFTEQSNEKYSFNTASHFDFENYHSISGFVCIMNLNFTGHFDIYEIRKKKYNTKKQHLQFKWLKNYKNCTDI